MEFAKIKEAFALFDKDGDKVMRSMGFICWIKLIWLIHYSHWVEIKEPFALFDKDYYALFYHIVITQIIFFTWNCFKCKITMREFDKAMWSMGFIFWFDNLMNYLF